MRWIWVALAMAVALAAGAGTGAWAAGPPSPPREGPADLLPPAPLELRLLTMPVPHARHTLRPWVAFSTEYNDNVLVTSADPAGDASTLVTAGLTAAWHRRRGEIGLGWSGGARAYAHLDSLNDLFDQETVLLSARLAWSPRVSASLTNLFLLNSRTNVISSAGVFTGRGRSWSNTLAPAMTFQRSRRTSVRFGLMAGIEHFESRPDDNLLGRARVAVDHVGSSRWTGSAGASLEYFDAGQGAAWAPGGRVGLHVRVSRRWLASAAAGPVRITKADGSAVEVAGTAVLRRSLKRGEVRLEYDRSPGVAGEYGGPTINQTLAGRLVLEPRRRMTLAVVPAYRTYRSPRGLPGDAIDLEVSTADLRIAVPVARRLDLIGSYSYLRQREELREAVQVQVQNRFLIGLRLVPVSPLPAPESGRTDDFER